MQAEAFVHVRGRKRTWQRNWAARKEADVTVATVEALFGMRAVDAARTLGVSRSTLQRICRQLGIKRWPFSGRTPQAYAQWCAVDQSGASSAGAGELSGADAVSAGADLS
jgi:hypothetical protein